MMPLLVPDCENYHRFRIMLPITSPIFFHDLARYHLHLIIRRILPPGLWSGDIRHRLYLTIISPIKYTLYGIALPVMAHLKHAMGQATGALHLTPE